MSSFIQVKNRFDITADNAVNVTDNLPPAVYVIKFDKLADKYYLESGSEFKLPEKLYGDTKKNGDRILNTFFAKRSSLGVMMVGEKGSGKSLLAKYIGIKAMEKNMPVVLVNDKLHGEDFNKFIADISHSAVIIFDEFEKHYEYNSIGKILTLFDGMYSQKKLFILTMNELSYHEARYMHNRPGRFHYYFKFENLSDDFIREYSEDNLNNKDNIEGLITYSKAVQQFSFDMLQSLVFEMNLYDENAQEASENLNIRPEFSENADCSTTVYYNNNAYTSPYNEVKNYNISTSSFEVRIPADYMNEGANLEKYTSGKMSSDDDDIDFRYYYVTPDMQHSFDSLAGSMRYKVNENIFVDVLPKAKYKFDRKKLF